MSIYNPKSIVEGYITPMRAMPALVTLVGGTAANIFAMHAVSNNSTDLGQTINMLNRPGAMLYWVGAQQVRTQGGRVVLENSLQLVLKLTKQSDYMDFWTEFVNGTPTSGTRKLVDIEIASCLEPMRDWGIARQSYAVTEATSVDYFTIGFAVRQSGS